MGKQTHEMRNKEETSFPLASLRDNLTVSIHDFEGNEIAHTDVETRSIVEKVVWDDLFLLEGGGKIRMRLQFILTEDEQNRIRSMRESATRKKHDDLVDRRHSSAELASASGGSPSSLPDSLKSRHKTKGRSVDLSDSQANKISADSIVKSLNKAQPGQKTQAFSTSKSTGSLQKLAAYQHLKERDQGQEAEQQNQLNKTPSKVESPATSKTRATTRLSSCTTVDIPSKAPSLKKAVAITTKPILFELEALSTPEEIGMEQEKISPGTNKTKETSQLSSIARVDTPSKELSLKKMVGVSDEPVLSKIAKPSAPEELERVRGELLPPSNETMEAAQLKSNARDDAPSKVPISKKIVDVNYDIFNETQTTKEEHKGEKELHISPIPESTFSMKKIFEALPKRTESLNSLLNGKRGTTTTYDPSVTDKKWRSKQWKSSRHRAKPKIFHENEHYAMDSWICLDEMIGSCVIGDDRPFVDVHDGCLSHCKQEYDQEKLTDTVVTHTKSEKRLKGKKELKSSKRRRNNPSFTGPAGQAVKVAIMASFGVLVFFTRQKK
ncbi:Kinesin-related protein SMY1 [Bienertia sinuspersici]